MYYYLAYVCGKPQAVAIVGMILSMPMLFLIPLSKPLVAKIGMKNGLVAGVLIMSLGRVVVGFGGSSSLTAIYIGSIIFSLGCSTQWCSYPLLCNTVEYGEWKNGHRQEGMIMSANSFGSKCGTALGTAICGWILQLSGYNGAVQAQSSSALTGITIVYVVLPVVLNIFSANYLSFYKLEKDIHLSFRNYVIESKKFKEIIMGNKAFYPGQTWLDTEGKRIQAHGGSVIYVDGIYYWYGENKKKLTERMEFGIGE